ncbi:MAG: hypothetical protein RL208_307 [Pseudomonadota bacterium]|jgi:hypothetical protein
MIKVKIFSSNNAKLEEFACNEVKLEDIHQGVLVVLSDYQNSIFALKPHSFIALKTEEGEVKELEIKNASVAKFAQNTMTVFI